MLRLYPNAGGSSIPGAPPWVIDRGEGSPVELFRWVGLSGTFGVTVERRGALPSSWIEFEPDYWLELQDKGGALIVGWPQ